MIRKLRIKLILVSMCSLMAVLGLILGGINFLYYREVVSDADDTLEFLMENGGTFPKQEWENDKVDFSMAVRYAKSILKSGKTQGFVGNYRYLVSDDADKVQIVFLDCGRTLSAFRRDGESGGFLCDDGKGAEQEIYKQHRAVSHTARR